MKFRRNIKEEKLFHKVALFSLIAEIVLLAIYFITFNEELSATYELEYNGTKFLCKNGHGNSYNFADKIHKYDAVILYHFEGSIMKYLYSVYSSDASSFDCKAFCEKFGWTIEKVKIDVGYGKWEKIGEAITDEDIRLMKSIVGDAVKVKAAGGISSLEDAENMIKAGADRLGTSRIVKIVKSNSSDSGAGY